MPFSSRPGNKAKPNTRFLQNIIKSTKNHNAALLAKETAESQARLNNLAEAHQQKQRRYKPDASDTRRRQLGAISAILSGKRKHGEHGDPDQTAHAERTRPDKSCPDSQSQTDKRLKAGDEGGKDGGGEPRRPARRDEERGKSESKGRRDRSRSPTRRRERRDRDYRERSPAGRRHRRDSSDSDMGSGAEAPKDDSSLIPRREKKAGQSGSHGHEQEDGRARGLVRERQKERSWRSGPLKGELMGRILPTGKGREERRLTREESSDQHRTRQGRTSQSHREVGRASRHGAPEPGSSHREDLLHTRVSDRERKHRLAEEESRSAMNNDEGSDSMEESIGPAPPVRGRGRGAGSGSSAMDNRFSQDYDPNADAELDPEEMEDWDEAVEAYRDRQKWRQQGADRLRTAGFTDEQIQTWEKGGEPPERDVLWDRKGERREWDRGKVVSDGVTKATPDWAI
ncbi:hypothetical protein GQ53DRAFT_752312 [Thozetella sp. PMI_491]|nr:hypothetical protein GQ53DRAFT_752312 [Thozetella sp. PMI_491]